MLVLLGWLFTGAATACEAPGHHAIVFEDLVDHAETVVVGRVVDLERALRHGVVVTTYTIETTATIAGEPAARHVLTLPGGRTADAVVRATGVPVWDLGDEVLVLLREDRRPILRGVFGLAGDRLVAEPGHPVRALPATVGDLRDRLPVRVRDGR